MRYKEFGKTGVKVSEMTLGTWGIGGTGWDNYSEETRTDAIRAAVEQGINFIDSAPAYNAGVAEQYVGRTLKEMGVRKDMILSTKCGTKYVDGSYIRDCSKATIIEQCETSLKNLQTDYIDFYLVHWPDKVTSMEEMMDAMNTLKQQGKILHIGLSNFKQDAFEEALKYAAVEAYQPQYSMVNRTNEEQIKWAAEHGIGVMSYGSLGGGILTGAIREVKTYDAGDSRNRFYTHFQEPMFSKIMSLVKVMDEMSEKHGSITDAQIALNWASQKDFVSTCLVGAQTRKKIIENAATFQWSLSDEELAILDQAIETYLK